MKCKFPLQVCIALLFALSGCTQHSDTALHINREEALADIDSFAHALKEIHPDLFFNCPEQTFNDSLNHIRNQFTQPTYSPLDLYKRLQPLTTLLGDGHTQLYFPKEALEKENVPVFPLLVEVNTNDSTLWLNHDFSNGETTLKKGTQLISINGKDYRSLIADMLPYCGGERIFFRLSKVNRDFVHFLYMLYPANRFSVGYRTGNLQKECVVNAVPYREYAQNLAEQTPHREAYQFEIKDRHTALMTFNAFTNLEQFKLFADSMFRSLKEKQIEHLIIDLRMNGGGDSNIGDELFQYIASQPFQQFGKYVTRYSELQKKLAKENFGTDYSTHPNGLDTTSSFPLIRLRPNPLRFNGKVTLLISHTTFSSASAFAWAFQKMKRGVLIGEESGGMSVCFGDVVIYRLPHTHIASTLSFARVFLYDADEADIHGVLPDIETSKEEALHYALNRQNRS